MSDRDSILRYCRALARMHEHKGNTAAADCLDGWADGAANGFQQRQDIAWHITGRAMVQEIPANRTTLLALAADIRAKLDVVE